MDKGRYEQSTLLSRWSAPQYIDCVVQSILNDFPSHRYRFIDQEERIWKWTEGWAMRITRDWEGVLVCWSEAG